MKVLLVAAIALLALSIQVEATWPNYNGVGFGNGFGRRHNSGPQWLNPQLQNNEYGSNVEWVCQNPRTGDTMIIASDNLPEWNNRAQPQGRPWHNIPPGHQKNHGQSWFQPLLIIEDKPTNSETGNDPLPSSPPPSEEPSKDNNQPRSTPRYHGGEGEIDIRMGE